MVRVYLFVLLFLFLFFYTYFMKSERIFLKNLLNHKQDYTYIQYEAKHKPPLLDNYLILPSIINFEVIKDIKKKYNPIIIVAVLSSPHNFRKRYSFRKRSIKSCYKQSGCKFIFFIGTSNYLNRGLMRKEMQLYNDIVQFSFQNSYLNLTILSIMAMRYCFKHYSKIKYYIKTDDDMLVNYDLLFDVLSNGNIQNNNIYGHYHRSIKVNKRSFEENYVPNTVYVHENFPEFVFGGLIIIPYSSLCKIYNITNYEQHYIWIEDINLAVLCKICNITVKQFPYNIDIRLKRKDCNLNRKTLAIEIFTIYDYFYC